MKTKRPFDILTDRFQRTALLYVGTGKEDHYAETMEAIGDEYKLKFKADDNEVFRACMVATYFLNRRTGNLSQLIEKKH